MAQIGVIRSQSEDFAFDERTFDIVVLKHYVFFQAFYRVIIIGTLEFSQQYLDDTYKKRTTISTNQTIRFEFRVLKTDLPKRAYYYTMRRPSRSAD